MSKLVLKNASPMLGSLLLASQVNKIDLGVSAEEVDVSSFADNGWSSFLPGIRKSDVSLEGYVEIPEPDLTLDGYLADATVLPFGCTITYPPAAGDVCYFLKAVVNYMTRKAEVGKAFAMSLKLTPQEELVRGPILFNGDIDADGSTTPLDLTLTLDDTQRLWIAIWVTAASGTTPTLDLLLESDDDSGFPSATTRITVPQFTGVGYYIGSVDGPITPDTFYRLTADIGGTGSPSFTLIAAIGIAPIG